MLGPGEGGGRPKEVTGAWERKRGQGRWGRQQGEPQFIQQVLRPVMCPVAFQVLGSSKEENKTSCPL